MGEPQVVERAAQPYAAIGRSVTMAQLGEVLPPLNARVADWLDEHGGRISGPPFWRYRVIDMERELRVDVGFPTETVLDGDDEVSTGELPAGRYVDVVHHGHPDTLVGATADLLAWAEAQGLVFDRHDGPDGDVWESRLEFYLTDPDDEPDLGAWDTELAFKLA
ncbi:hypothetical protein FHX74_001436 [Friedmanniella endophytica]|uniref:AraC effector-binding domain-containing protein n=1 Tax=Microlunatus kandeliicorticis TaxID=1759536 RepID=A0A7W3P5C8_9ACTN|nr:GyrI-like domain-containing protein [Microlunatus kandeliicorticis]MBA8793831.1 hypothetical protein [Microlunatus kandeliicorticis]